jgi:hypothetical protein
MIFLGSGPSCGTAIFSAAKVVEAASVFSVGQDLEEWWHVEKFALPANIPTFLIAPPGRSYWRAVDLAVTAKQLERRLIGILKETDDQIKLVCDLTLPVIGEVREEFSSLVYHVAADLFASYLAEKLGRMLFQSDNPAFRSLVWSGPAGFHRIEKMIGLVRHKYGTADRHWPDAYRVDFYVAGNDPYEDCLGGYPTSDVCMADIIGWDDHDECVYLCHSPGKNPKRFEQNRLALYHRDWFV